MDVITGILILVLALTLLYIYVTQSNQTSRLPGPKRYPIVGSALQLKPGHFHQQFFDFARQYGDIFELKLFGTSIVVLNSADVVNKAFCGDGYKQIFNNRPPIFIGNHIYKGKDIMLRNADKLHSELRKALSKGLHAYGDGIPRFEKVIKEEIHRVMDQIEQYGGQEFEVVELAQRSLCNVISILLIGEHATETDILNFVDFLEVQDFFLNPVTNTVLLNLPCFLRLPFFKNKFNRVMASTGKIVDKYFNVVKASRVPGTIRGLVDWYLEEQQKEMEGGGELLLTDDVIKANMLETITAGILTTASVLPCAILCLINHPGYQTQIQEELDRVVGPNREPAVSDKHNCDFIQAVIMEAMRYLPGPLSLPHVCSQDTQFEGFHINANTQVFANFWYMFHAEEVWGDPWVFRPERFLDETGKLLPNTHVLMKSWLPFGTGRRKCPGMSLATSRLFLYLSCLFQRWTFLPSPGKCGSSHPYSGSFDVELLLTPKPFYCIAKRSN